jgi:hypothetical protein
MTEMLRTGMTPDLRKVGSTMYGVVQNTALLSAEDRDAIAIYIKTLAPRPTPSGYEDVPY